MGKGIVEELKQEFPLEDEWIPFEIHADTPKEGVLLADYFRGMDPTAFFKQLDARGKEVGVRFGPQKLMSNSRQALEGGEFAKVYGRHDEYHEAVFRSFFTDCRDIGQREVILDAARSAGLDVEKLAAALDAGTYLPQLEEATRSARSRLITAVPTFLINGSASITGAQPIETFRSALRDMK